MKLPAASPTGLWRWVRGVVGVGLLAGLVVFAWKHGTLLRHLDPALLARVIGLATASVLANGALMAWIGRGQPPPGRPLSFGEALQVSSFGSFANAAGGIPIGTVMVFGTLMRRHRFSLTGIAMGKGLGAVLNIGWMLLIVAAGLEAGIGVGASRNPTALAWAAGLLGLLCLGLPPLVRGLYLKTRFRAGEVFRNLAGPLWPAGLAITGVMAFTNVALYAVVVRHYLPASGWGLAIGWAAASLVLGFLLSVNTIGGAQEIVAGLSGLLFRLPLVVGVELALVVRLGTIVATGVVAGLAWWQGWRRLEAPAPVSTDA